LGFFADFLHTIPNKINHDRWTILGAVLALGILGWLVGCRSRTASTRTPQNAQSWERRV